MSVNELEPQIFLIDKPLTATSFDMVAIVRNSLNKELGLKIKISHAGTLDPLATGVLVILIGRATKAQDLFLKQDKSYSFTIKLGVKTSTADLEGLVVQKKAVPMLSSALIKKTIKQFLGKQKQQVPLYSAVQVEGKRLYQYARSNTIPKNIPTKDIEIKKIELIKYSKLKNEISLAVSCSSGTYVRTLAEDISAALKTVGHVVNLRRTLSGEFNIADCTPIHLHNAY